MKTNVNFNLCYVMTALALALVGVGYYTHNSFFSFGACVVLLGTSLYFLSFILSDYESDLKEDIKAQLREESEELKSGSSNDTKD